MPEGTPGGRWAGNTHKSSRQWLFSLAWKSVNLNNRQGSPGACLVVCRDGSHIYRLLLLRQGSRFPESSQSLVALTPAHQGRSRASAFQKPGSPDALCPRRA